MKDDEVESLFAYGWLDLLLAAILTLCGIAVLFFAAGYLL